MRVLSLICRTVSSGFRHTCSGLPITCMCACKMVLQHNVHHDLPLSTYLRPYAYHGKGILWSTSFRDILPTAMDCFAALTLLFGVLAALGKFPCSRSYGQSRCSTACRTGGCSVMHRIVRKRVPCQRNVQSSWNAMLSMVALTR